MISHPGDIVHRFGRYEAVEDLGRNGSGHLWRAWDPYLERFVLVAAAPNLEPAEMFRQVKTPEALLERELGAEFAQGRPIFDFGPPTRATAAFFVLPLDAAQPPPSPSPAPPEPRDAAAPQAPARRGALILGTVAAFAVGALLGSFLGHRADTSQPAVAEAPSAKGDQLARPAAVEPNLAPTATRRADTPPAAVIPTEAPSAPAPVAAAVPDPPPGVIRLATGESRRFSVAFSDSTQAAVWRLDGTQMRSGADFEYRSKFAEPPGAHSLQLTVTDQGSGVAIDHSWTIITETNNVAPVVRVGGARAVRVGEVVALTGDVQDADLKRGDEVRCEWSIGGRVAGTNCRGLEWRAPAAAGTQVVTLTARDAAGAAATSKLDLVINAAARSPNVDVAVAPQQPTPKDNTSLDGGDEARGRRVERGDATSSVRLSARHLRGRRRGRRAGGSK